jgi:hypothetical protein
MFFNSHGQLVEVTDKAFQEQGRRFLVKMRGEKYARQFTRFMSTIARLKKESDEKESNEKIPQRTGESVETQEPQQSETVPAKSPLQDDARTI